MLLFCFVFLSWKKIGFPSGFPSAFPTVALKCKTQRANQKKTQSSDVPPDLFLSVAQTHTQTFLFKHAITTCWLNKKKNSGDVELGILIT